MTDVLLWILFGGFIGLWLGRRRFNNKFLAFSDEPTNLSSLKDESTKAMWRTKRLRFLIKHILLGAVLGGTFCAVLMLLLGEPFSPN